MATQGVVSGSPVVASPSHVGLTSVADGHSSLQTVSGESTLSDWLSDYPCMDTRQIAEDAISGCGFAQHHAESGIAGLVGNLPEPPFAALQDATMSGHINGPFIDPPAAICRQCEVFSVARTDGSRPRQAYVRSGAQSVSSQHHVDTSGSL